MRQNNIAPPPGSRKAPKRVGRGNASGHGTYAGRGLNGQKSRSGHKMRPGFEGGQLPLIKRLPRKRGFVNIFRKEYSIVNVDKLNIFEEGSEVTPEKLHAAGLVKTLKHPVKILATGEVGHAVTVRANKFSAAAKAKIEAAGGKAEEVEYAGQVK
ncbi:MAG: 50S ribosomal protein L15 [Dehalococcoidia bacterium]|nr:50S ribosomal protein L15 [Dehalococcoidia bacterium]MQY81092.1 50S ribosomal protein L15 [Dehalococcoidia bacterium]TES88362.1 MAG: 50S ribosomal protein L15 [Dehalococcoidia bacterium]TET45355.1 MAG: 50S ribosomal protein L15 [Dehalococcoidia bacterium]